MTPHYWQCAERVDICQALPHFLRKLISLNFDRVYCLRISLGNMGVIRLAHFNDMLLLA